MCLGKLIVFAVAAAKNKITCVVMHGTPEKSYESRHSQLYGGGKMINQRERILQYLREEGSITRAEAFAELGIVELPARICELEKMGFEFKKDIIRKKNRYGDPIRFTKYTLKDGEIHED